ncbi:protein kinase domain-containing protein [Parendozoicomonas haliclonae]|uniref:Serine/threonine-protein kinase PknA n=1 Tax=Parendozoicomonas haliclonae TaxID=1960125 RepID=A0A1X7AMM2_9GAMM|nr:protein kinase [Parendozoicomonas haliclonae]SMA49523.1 Serine/threonine-protein kinase PknA [Parendozoicomonas haliclonae]
MSDKGRHNRRWHIARQVKELIFYLLLCLALPVVASTEPEDAKRAEDVLELWPLRTVPAGTVLRYGDARVLMPGVNLPEQVAQALTTAAVTTVTRKLIHHFLIWTLGNGDRFLSHEHYLRLLGWYQSGLMDDALWSWHYLVRLTHMVNMGQQLLHGGINRWFNLSGLKRVGQMPVYPGRVLDSHLLMDIRLDLDWQDRATAVLDIIPLKSTPAEEPLPPRLQQIHQLSVVALQNHVDQIRLIFSPDDSVSLGWHKHGGEWRERLVSPAATKPHSSWLLRNLVTSYGLRESEAWSMGSVLDTDMLQRIQSIIAGKLSEDDICETHPALEVAGSSGELVRLNDRHLIYQSENSHELLHILNNDSYSPGLPGVMILGSDIAETSETVRQSRQYRLPEWLAAIGASMLYDAAALLMNETLDAVLEKANRHWHGADNFELVKRLKVPKRQRGGVATRVDRVRDKQGKTWVRKYLNWDHMAEDDKYSGIFASLAREKQILMELDDEHIIRLKDSWVENAGHRDATLVLLEEDAGESLIHKYKRINSAKTLKNVFRGTLQGLDAAHKKGFAHFDIKPENIMEDGQGHIRLGDFGGASRLGADGRAQVGIMTPSYAAPEMHYGKSSHWQADLWSLGITGYNRASKKLLGDLYTNDIKLLQKTRSRFELMDYLPSSVRTGKKTPMADFFTRLLVSDPVSRPSIPELLQHPFLAEKPSPLRR